MFNSSTGSDHAIQRPNPRRGDPPRCPPPVQVEWATTWAEVREAQRLRFRVFAQEFGADVPSGRYGLDADEFDPHCDHLLARDGADGPVVGTYRVLMPEQARAAGGLYNDRSFDLAALAPLRPRMAELGRACVDARFRHGGVILALWGALAAFMASRQIDWLLGSCSLPLGASPAGPAALCRRLGAAHPCDPGWSARPLSPLPPSSDTGPDSANVPPLLQGYLRLGARVLGPPAWDSAFHCADLPLLLRYSDLPPRFRRRGATASAAQASGAGSPPGRH